MSKLYRWTLEALPDSPTGSPEMIAQATGAPRMAASMIAAAGAQLAAELHDELVAAGFAPFPGESTGSSTPPAATNGGGRRAPRKRTAPPAAEPGPEPQHPPIVVPFADQVPVGAEHVTAPPVNPFASEPSF